MEKIAFKEIDKNQVGENVVCYFLRKYKVFKRIVFQILKDIKLLIQKHITDGMVEPLYRPTHIWIPRAPMEQMISQKYSYFVKDIKADYVSLKYK